MTKDEIVQQAETIQGWMERVELKGLYDLTQEIVPPGGEVLEVGSWKGRSSYVFGSVLAEKKGRLSCVDTFVGSELDEAHYKEAKDMGAGAFIEAHVRKNLAGLPVLYYVGNSTAVHSELRDNWYDLVFVDGNHCEPVISQDLRNYYKKVKPGKMLVCHDYCDACPDVKKAINTIFGVDRISYFCRSVVGIIKLPDGKF